MRRLDVYVVGPYSVALVVSLFFYYQALQIAPAAEGQIGADAWPKAILLLAIVTCIWEIARSFLGDASHPAADSNGESSDAALLAPASAPDNASELSGLTPWIGIALTAAYVFAFPWIGYPLATFLYVAVFVFFGNYRRPLVAACVGIVAGLGFMYLFMRIVYVSLPIGVEPFAQVSTLLMRAMGIK